MLKREIVKEAKTIEEAVELACEELGIDRNDASVEVLEMPKKGFLGLGQVEAKVKVSCDIKEENKLEVAKNYLWSLLNNMGLENFDIDVNEKSNRKVVFTLRGDNLGLVIGKRGDTLNAIQQLCSVVANMSGGPYYTIVVDVENYRQTRDKVLRELALKISKSVIRSQRKIVLEPMNSYERKVMHQVIQDIDGVGSKSKGEEPRRYVVIFPDSNKKIVRGSKVSL